MHDTTPHHSHDGGWSIAFVLTALVLKIASMITFNTITNLLTVAMLFLAIVYHVMGISERWDKFFLRMAKLKSKYLTKK